MANPENLKKKSSDRIKEQLNRLKKDFKRDKNILTEYGYTLVSLVNAEGNNVLGIQATDHSQYLKSALSMHSIMHYLVVNTEIFFFKENVPFDQNPNKHFIVYILRFIRYSSVALESNFTQHSFNPYIDLYKTYLIDLSGSDFFETKMNRNKKHVSYIPDHSLKFFQNILDQIRIQAKSKEFISKIKGIQRASNSNKKSLLDYLTGLFERYARLLVIRLDLGYSQQELFNQHQTMRDETSRRAAYINSLPESEQIGKSKFDPTIPLAPATKPKLGFDLDDIIRHREEFIEYLRKNFNSNLKGFAWKLEYGFFKGYHYHLIIMLDGSMHREYVTIGKMLGEYWNRAITNGNGIYYNCVAVKNKYRHCAVGVQHHTNPELLTGLTMIADYMTKSDLYVKLVLPKNHRTFGRGVLPKLTNRGRPRKNK